MSFWLGRRVLVTGHSGFKGNWLTLWLRSKGADVLGLSLTDPPQHGLFETESLSGIIEDRRADIRDLAAVSDAVVGFAPSIVFHLAAQSLVLESYRSPLETYSTNVLGTATLLEALRSSPDTKAVIVATSDKCYENQEWIWGYRESDPLGGKDPYSSSKACTELVVASYRSSFYSERDRRVGIATVRAGNVIGGGDWSSDRLIPDLVRAFANNEKAQIRRPNAVRPWQHVLEPLAGYMRLAERLTEGPNSFDGAWNFGPREGDCRSVREVASLAQQAWGAPARWEGGVAPPENESTILRLDSSRARQALAWQSKWELEVAISHTISWYREVLRGEDPTLLAMRQIRLYEEST